MANKRHFFFPKKGKKSIENINKKPLNSKFLEKQERCNSQSKFQTKKCQSNFLKTNFTNILKNSIPYYNKN